MKKEPVVLCLTNSVATNFTANCLLAVGARPLMLCQPDEIVDGVAVSDGVLINVGTLYERQSEAMLAAAKACNDGKIPWVIDPVGVQVLEYRRDFVMKLLNMRPTMVRGNRAEVDFLCANFNDFRSLVPHCLATGEIDDADGVSVPGGVEMLTRVTATGCAQGALCAAELGRGRDPHDAAVFVSRLMKRAGERAWQRAKAPGSFQTALVDALYELSQSGVDHAID